MDRNWQVLIVEDDPGAFAEGECPINGLAEAALVVARGDQVAESSAMLQALRGSATELFVFLIVVVVGRATPEQILAGEPLWLESGADATLVHRGDAADLALDVELCVRRLRRRRDEDAHHAIAQDMRAEQEEEMGEHVPAQTEHLFWQTAHIVAPGFPKLDASLPARVEKGSSIGPCVVLSILGRGAFGRVYLAVGHDDAAPAEAVKALSKRVVTELGHFDTLHKEIRVLKGLSHPNIVRCYGAVHGPGHIFIRLEFVGKRNLMRVMRDHGSSLPMQMVRDFQQQLADAVSYCHTAGTAHRDIKPENIGVCDEEVTIKLLDFGTACPVYKACDTVIGTMPFIAPEVMCLSENAAYFPADVDAWAMGVVLLEMSCGAGALNARMGWAYDVKPAPALGTALRTACRANPDMWAEMLHEHVGPIPQALEALIQGLLEVYPAKRWTAAEAARSPWTRDGRQELVCESAGSSPSNKAASSAGSTAAFDPLPPAAPRLGSLVRRMRAVADAGGKRDSPVDGMPPSPKGNGL